jgi:hypothetical protein
MEASVNQTCLKLSCFEKWGVQSYSLKYSELLTGERIGTDFLPADFFQKIKSPGGTDSIGAFKPLVWLHSS